VILVRYSFSAVVLAFGYVVALGPVGILTTSFKEWTGVVPCNLYSFPFLVAIAGLTHVPHVYLYAAAALRGLAATSRRRPAPPARILEGRAST